MRSNAVPLLGFGGIGCEIQLRDLYAVVVSIINLPVHETAKDMIRAARQARTLRPRLQMPHLSGASDARFPRSRSWRLAFR